MTPETSNRKFEHIKIVSNKKVQAKKKTNWFEYVEFVHSALPDINKKDINLNAKFFGKKLSLPLVIEGMTGGHKKSHKINKNLAVAAQKSNIALGIGSQRAMLESPKLSYTYEIRDFAPDVFLIGNLGIPQLKEFSINEIKNALKKIDANAVAIHLNYLQEIVQKEGDVTAKNNLKILSKFCRKSKLKVIAKETGAGISKQTAKSLIKAGVSAVDIGGAGGTSWSAVEILRQKIKDENLFEFWDWGIPTAASILEVRSTNKKIPLIASGGIRTGLEAAKSLALGSNIVGVAYPFFKAAQKSPKHITKEIEKIANGLKNTMFLVGAKNILELRKIDLVLLGNLFEWAKNRHIKQGK